MQKYHYTDGTNSFGPFTLEELRHKNITAETYVWSPDLTNWTKAGEIPELTEIVNAYHSQQSAGEVSAPPLPQPQIAPTYNSGGTPYTPLTNNIFEQPPKSYLIEAIIATIVCCIPLGIPAIVYATKVEKKFYMGDKIGAEIDSKNAKKWIIIAVVGSIIFYLLYFGIIGGLAYFGSTQDASDYSY